MTDQEWNLARIGEHISRTGGAGLDVEASVDNLRAEVRDAGKLAAETLELLRQGFADLAKKHEFIEQRLARLESIEEQLNEVIARHRASHWIAPYTENGAYSNEWQISRGEFSTFEYERYTHVAIANPGPKSVECELSVRSHGQVEKTWNFTIDAGSRYNNGDFDVEPGFLELKASDWVLPAAWFTDRTTYGPNAQAEANRTGKAYSSEVFGEAFAIPWYPVN